MNRTEIASASTKDLLAFYNKHAAKSISKFENRAAAERRVLALIESMPAAPVEPGCPFCGAPSADITAAGAEGTVAGDTRSFCHHCSTEWITATGKRYNAPKANADRSASIAATWNDAEVRAARSARHAVSVDGVQYKSVPAAFRALHLSFAKLVPFRLALVAAGKCVDEAGRKWKLVS